MKVRKVNLPCKFDMSMYDISLDLECRKLVFSLKELQEDEDFDKNNIINFFENYNKGHYFLELGMINKLFCELESGELVTLIDAFCVTNSPITFHFNRSVKGIWYNDKEKLKEVSEINFCLSYIDDLKVLKEYYRYELKNFDLEIFINNEDKLFTIKAINKDDISVKTLNKKLNNVVFLLSLVLYNPFSILLEKYVLKESSNVCEYHYDSIFTGYRKNKLICDVSIRELFENIFIEESIDKFLFYIDKNYTHFIKLYLYLIDKKNTNYANISDFLMIQLMISAEQNYICEKKYNKETLEGYFSHKYISEFVKEEMNSKNKEKYLNELADTRNGIGHFTVLFKGDIGSTKRKPTKALNIGIFDYHKLLLIFPFFIYETMCINVDNMVIKKIVEDFEDNFRKD